MQAGGLHAQAAQAHANWGSYMRRKKVTTPLCFEARTMLVHRVSTGQISHGLPSSTSLAGYQGVLQYTVVH